MEHLREKFFERTPKCLSKFKTSYVSIPLPLKKDDSYHFVTKSVQCICGNEKLYLDVAQHKEAKGVCRVSEFMSFMPPVYVVCSSCKQHSLLFDSLMHGWKSESGESSDANGEFKLMRCTQKPGHVFVSYSYKNTEAYEALLAREVENLEDYFDNFAVFYTVDSVENIREIISVACG